ncbi:MAG: heavy-metal-associated domain-containing protein [Candidatus Sericytochromatia bacterium]
MNTYFYSASGMTCQGCVRAVTRAVQKADPGSEVSVDLEQGEVVVHTDLPAETVRTLISEAGYPAEQVD